MRTGQQVDIDEAISLHRQDLEFHIPSHRERLELNRNLATALSTRFKLTGQRADIDEAISLRRQNLELLPPSHPERLIILNDLAYALSSRFHLIGQNIDIDEAISLHRQVVVLDSSLHPCQSMTVNGLARALSMRFRQGGQQVDIDEAIHLLRQDLETDPNSSTFVHNLASALSSRFDRIGQKTDIDEAISLYRQNLAPLSLSDPKLSTCFFSFAHSLFIRFQRFVQRTDLDEGISIYRKCFSASHPLLKKTQLFHNLALALAIRFKLDGQQSDFDEAFSLFKQTLEVRISLNVTSSPSSLTGLGMLCLDAHSWFGEKSEYLEQAMTSFSASAQCPSQSAFARLLFAKIWISRAEQHGHPSVFSAYEAALQALPQAAALSLDIQSRQEALASSDGLARNAARCAIRAGKLEKAVEFLEGGRSVFWSQVLSLRSPISKLHDIAPELANKLQDIATALELGSHRDISRDISDFRQNLSIEEESSKLNRLNEEWAISIHKVRKLKGFEDFLRPRCLSALQAAASKSPVVILVANHDGSHCLILTSTTIHHIDLPCLHTPMLQNLVRLVQVGVSQSRVSRSSINTIVENINTFPGENRKSKVVNNNKLGSSDDVFKLVLGMLWDDIVNPVIRLLKIQVSALIWSELASH
jgi:tetratricopeptide (TPR) repeat protein